MSSKDNLIKKLLKHSMTFIIVTVGVLFGSFLSYKFVLSDTFSNNTHNEPHIRNLTNIKQGDKFPDFSAESSDGNLIDLVQLVKGQKTIIGLVSDGCQPCETFMTFLENSVGVQNGKYNVILLSRYPDFYLNNYNYQTYEISQQSLTDFEIHSLPTILGINENMEVAFVTSGFSQIIDDTFLSENL